MGIYSEAIPEVVDFWTERIAEVLEQEFGVKSDPEQIKREFEAAVQAGEIAAFIAAHGEEEAQKQGHKRYLAEMRRAEG